MRDPSASIPHALCLIAQSEQNAWQGIEHAWPAWCETPRVETVTPDRLFRTGTPGRARTAVVDIADRTTLFQVVDALREAGVPPIVLVDPDSFENASRACTGAVVLPNDEPPHAIALAINTVMERQSAFDTVQQELDVSRRFQGGLRGEMDKLHEELQLAASVQQELLPRTMPDVPGAEFGVIFNPAGYVSGDIYDVQRLNDHTIGFFLADAVGHGVPAALMTMVIARGIQFRVRTHEGVDERTPGEALRFLNQDLVRRHSHSPRFATAMAGTLDTRTREITLAGAGHPPALVYGPDGTRRIGSTGGLLGVFEEDAFDDVTFTLGDDETLVLYTDGFETAFPTGSEETHDHKLATRVYEERFEHFATARAASGMGAAMESLRSDLNRASGSLHQVDDITAMIIGPKPLAQRDRPAA
ncbi:MAG: SpoIIE family protein phosphatase [Planctomycetota bacterium]